MITIKKRKLDNPSPLPKTPEALKELSGYNQWVTYGAAGPMDKIPRQADGQPASVSDPKTWCSHAQAVAAVEAGKAGKAGGIGFVFTVNDPFCGIDFDDCRDPKTGEIALEAREHIEALDSYTEISPSGTGLHVIVRAAVPQGRKWQSAEIYSDGRYFTFSGCNLTETPATIEHRQVEVNRILQSLASGSAIQSSAIKEGDIKWDADPKTIEEPLKVLLENPEARRAWDHQLPDQGDQTNSGYDFKLACLAVEKGWKPTAVFLLIDAHRRAQGDTTGKGVRRDYIVRTVGKALAWLETDAEDHRLRIEHLPGKTAKACEQIAAALAAATAKDPLQGVYRMNGYLVELVHSADRATPGQGDPSSRGVRTIRPLDQAALEHRVERDCRFVRYDDRRKKLVVTDAPPKAIHRMLSRPDHWPEIPPLTGLVSSPVLRWNATVLSQPGYDPESGLVFDPQGVVFGKIPHAPSWDDAREALHSVQMILKDFPFVDASSEATAVAALLTPLVRGACPNVPMFLATAPTMATGKSLLLALVGYIATGRRPTTIVESHSADEDIKRLVSLSRAGHTVITIDNVEGNLKSSTLCVALTEPEFTARLLGTNDMYAIKPNATFYASGNNLVAEGDLSSRVMVIALDAGVERPAERTFEVDLHKEVPKLRGQLVPALLTIVLAYLHASSPKVDAPIFGRFEDWCRLVRDPLMWLGMADACEGRRSVEAVDPVRQSLGALLVSWHAVFGSTPMKVGDVIKLVTPGAEIGKLDAKACEELREAMVDVAGSAHGVIYGNSLGKFIGKQRKRIEGGLRFERKGSSGNASRWAVIQTASSQEPTSAESEVSEVGEVESGDKEEKKATGALLLIKAGQKAFTDNKFSPKIQNLANLPNLPNDPSAEPQNKPTSKSEFNFFKKKGKTE